MDIEKKSGRKKIEKTTTNGGALSRNEVAVFPMRQYTLWAAWILSAFLLIVLTFILFRVPNLTPDQRGIVRLFMSLLAGLATSLFIGSIHWKGKILGISITAVGGVGVFALMQFVFNPFSLQPKIGDVAAHWVKRDEKVSEAQQVLKRLGIPVGPVFGVLDSLTAESIRRFQETNGLAQDGFVGPGTLAKLAQIASAAPPKLPSPTLPSPTPPPVVGAGRLRGVLTDRRGNPITGMIVSIRRGPEVRTDSLGSFVINDVPLGDQMIVVKSTSENGEWTKNIVIQTNGTTDAKIIYDAGSSRLGLLSIAAPVDGEEVKVRNNGLDYLAEVHGRCDGLSEVLGRFEVWVLIRSELDGRFWVQHPPAIVDLSANTWRANVRFGNTNTPPRDGERWHLVVVATPTDSAMRRIMNTPILTLLPQPHISGNAVTVVTATKQ